MEIFTTRAELEEWRAGAGTVAFVPTMGALHGGHLSLITLAQQRAKSVVASIFVNSTQFAPHEDFDSYPRDNEADAALLRAEGVEALYLPTHAEIYPNGEASPIKTGAAAEGLETDFRPHFFGGVANVVYRLFDHVKADIAVFGEKDYQQLQVVREMVAAQGLTVEIAGAPIARDEFGLALSSRNVYLSAEDLVVARRLNGVLRDVAVAEAPQALLDSGFDKVDYVAERWGRILAAAWVGKTRLIDNMGEESRKDV